MAAKKKQYNTKNVGTIWVGESKKGETYVSVPVVDEFNDKGKENKFFKGKIYFEDAESGEVYQIKKFKTFMNDNHEDILADLCVELDDEDFSVLVDGEE